jgi:hypothetical protein
MWVKNQAPVITHSTHAWAALYQDSLVLLQVKFCYKKS